jgi:CRP-like cAMP-binding protein
MELISRILDGSLPYDIKHGPPELPESAFRASQDDKIRRLERVPLLQDCSRRQLKAVARITEIVEAPAGRVLVQAGDPGDEFSLIVDGRARVEVPDRTPVQLGPGDYFGEMSLLDGGPRSATVVAETPLRLLVISRRDFATLLADVPELTRSILVTLTRRLRQAEQSQRP